MRCPVCNETKRGLWNLNRHHRSHFKDAQTVVCNGVPIERAAEYGIDLATATVEEFDGALRVGTFCRTTCSRKDVLIRHLKNPKCSCVNDALPAEWYATVRDL